MDDGFPTRIMMRKFLDDSTGGLRARVVDRDNLEVFVTLAFDGSKTRPKFWPGIVDWDDDGNRNPSRHRTDPQLGGTVEGKKEAKYSYLVCADPSIELSFPRRSGKCFCRAET